MSKPRSAARLAAVQALYQMDMEKIGLARLLDEFHLHRLGEDIEDAQIAHAEVSFFDDVVSGVNARREEIDGVIESKLGEQWKIGRLAAHRRCRGCGLEAGVGEPVRPRR